MSWFLIFLAEDTSWVFDLGAYEMIWDIVIQFGVVLVGLFLGNALRNAIPFLRKSLIPSALIGGLLLLITKIILNAFDVNVIEWTWNASWAAKAGASPSVAKIEFFDNTFLQFITYHGLAIGFIASTFRTAKVKNKVAKVKMFENGIMTGGAYMLQGFLGLAITIVWFLLSKNSDKVIYYSSGAILPLGFGQGPGNALTWDKNFSALLFDSNFAASTTGTTALFSGNGSFGLTIASVGFVVGSVIGVLHINLARKKGIIKVRGEETAQANIEYFVGENEIPDSESIDKFSVQVGLVAIAYGFAILIMIGFAVISKFTNSIAWGFNFIWGVIAATLIKLVLRGLKKKNIVKRNYINNHQMDRISGFAFDMMIVAGVAAIQIEFIEKYIGVLIVLCIVGTISTYLYVLTVSKHCFKGYEQEMFVTNFGTLTGTASNGMILLKEIDPNFVTPANNLFILSQFPAMLCVAPLLLVLNFSSQSLTNAIITAGIFFVLFAGYTIFLFRRKIFKKFYANKEEIAWQEE